MISLYLPGNSLIHRAPAWLKLLSLASLSIIMFFFPIAYWTAAVFIGFTMLLYIGAQLPLRMFFMDLLRISPILIFMIVTQLIFNDPESAATNTARVVTVILAAQVLTRTTSVDEMIGTLEKILNPLRPLGVNPGKIGLALSLLLNSVGILTSMVTQVRDAQKSRGVRISPWAWVIPVLVLSLKYADDVGDALVARGVEDT